VLNDPQHRREYDLHGVWPPPEPERQERPRRTSSSHHRTYTRNHHAPRTGPWPDPAFPFPNFEFTDPFTLFDSIFGAFPNHNRSQFDLHQRSQPQRSDNPFERARRMHSEIGNFMMNIEQDMFPGASGGFPNRSLFPSQNNFSNAATFGSGGRARWAKESMMTTTINGVTQSVHKRRDWDGTEHVTRTYPDGREVHTVNGVEQPSTPRGFLPYSGSGDARQQPPPPVVGQQRINNGSDYVPPPPPYPGHGPSGGYGSSPPSAEYDRRRDRRYSESRPVVPNMYNPDSGPVVPEYNHHGQPRKRWWRGG